MTADPDVPLGRRSPAASGAARKRLRGHRRSAAADHPARCAGSRANRCRPNESWRPRLGVSRDTVREAIKSLSDAGYLVSRRGRYGGTFLAEPLPTHTGDTPRVTRAEIDDALRLREILEVGAARMAASRTLTAAEREVLWARLTDVRGAARRRLPAAGLAVAPGHRRGGRLAVAGAAGGREPDAAQRSARPDPAAARATSRTPTSSTRRS